MPKSKHRKNHKQKANARKTAAANKVKYIEKLNHQLAEAIAVARAQQADPIIGPTLTLTPTPTDENNLPS
jgi:predicted nucleic acid-binding protein